MMLTLDGLASVLEVDRSSGLVRVQGGITIRELSGQLAGHGLAMENLGDVDAQSIAGAISTATHGTGAKLRNISSQVVGLTLVLGDGSTLECSQELDEEVFRAARVGLGTLGAGSLQSARFALRRETATASCAGNCAVCTQSCH